MWFFQAFVDPSSFLGGGVGVSLWEDWMMAGFMPLKAELSVKDTFSIPVLVSKLSTQASENHLCKISR